MNALEDDLYISRKREIPRNCPSMSTGSIVCAENLVRLMW
jgi:hypothetical protein